LPEAVFDGEDIGYLDEGPHKQDGHSLGPCFTFPLRNGREEVVGSLCRYKDVKKVMAGSHGGLYLPAEWKAREGPIFLPEGASCALSLKALGVSAVGRFHNQSGVEELAKLCRDLPADRPLVVVGEWDAKEDGRWPGLEGAVAVANQLAALRPDRSVSWCLPPKPHKDVRDWIRSHRLPTSGESRKDDWDNLRDRFLQHVEDSRQKAKPALSAALSWPPPVRIALLDTRRDGNGQGGGSAARTTEVDHAPPIGLQAVTLDQVQPKKVAWLWQDRIPLGKITMLDGDPDVGKSTLLLDIAARTTRGLSMPDGTPGIPAADVGLLAAEDEDDDTTVPRLIAAGADRSRVHLLNAIKEQLAATGPASERLLLLPNDLPVIEAKISQHGIKLLIIDPLFAFLEGRIDSYQDQHIRQALYPLRMLARRTGCAIILIRHLNKSGSGKALHRGGGSVGIRTSIGRAAHNTNS
jgi:hypothetical protein